MKNFFLLLTILSGLKIANGQTVVSSCSAPDSVISLFKDDADRLAVKKIFRVGSIYMDSIKIPKPWSDTVMNALIAVYNATALPARDTVINMYEIHTFPNPDLNKFSISADSNLIWMNQLQNNVVPTGNLSVDSLINNFSLNLNGYLNWWNIFPYHTAVFQSDSNYNIPALANRFLLIPGVFYAEPHNNAGDGSDINDSIYSSFVELIYSFGWEDCESGCISRRFWKFRVYPDCSVEYVGSYGTPLFNSTTTISEKNKTEIYVYPNPFKEKIWIANNSSTYEYKLINSFGQVIRQDKSSHSIISNLEVIPKGIYLLQLVVDDRIKIIKLVKE